MLLSAASVATLWAEQKIVPELPMRKLSRTLSGVAGTDAARPSEAIAAAMAMAILRISIPSARGGSDDYVAAARHRFVDVVIERDRRGVDQPQGRVDLAVLVLGVAAVALVALVGLISQVGAHLIGAAFRNDCGVRHAFDRTARSSDRPQDRA